MLSKRNITHFSIERFEVKEKFYFPEIKNLDPKDVINIYNYYKQLFPVSNISKLETNVATNLFNILDNLIINNCIFLITSPLL